MKDWSNQLKRTLFPLLALAKFQILFADCRGSLQGYLSFWVYCLSNNCFCFFILLHLWRYDKVCIVFHLRPICLTVRCRRRAWEAVSGTQRIPKVKATLKVRVVILPSVLLDSSVILDGLQDVCQPLRPRVCFRRKKKLWECRVAVSSTKVKTHLSRLNKSDKESLHAPPPKGRPKCPGKQSGCKV